MDLVFFLAIRDSLEAHVAIGDSFEALFGV